MSTNVSLHLSFDGNCAEAFAHYAKVLGGNITFTMSYAQSPMAETVAAADRDRLMHASMKLGDFVLMGADATSGHPFTGSEGFAVSVSYPSVAECEAIFPALGEGGTVIMPMGPTFWTKAFGMVKDRFGITWMVNCEQAPEAR